MKAKKIYTIDIEMNTDPAYKNWTVTVTHVRTKETEQYSGNKLTSVLRQVMRSFNDV